MFHCPSCGVIVPTRDEVCSSCKDDVRDGEFEQREAYLTRLRADISPEEVAEESEWDCSNCGFPTPHGVSICADCRDWERGDDFTDPDPDDYWWDGHTNYEG